jgi:hypothetical protein
LLKDRQGTGDDRTYRLMSDSSITYSEVSGLAPLPCDGMIAMWKGESMEGKHQKAEGHE